MEISLFDGSYSSLEANWRGYRSDSLPAKWGVDEEGLFFNPDAEGTGGDIITKQMFANFEFSLEWKISECGNSGIFYLVQESEQYANTYHTGPEFQVLDDSCHPDAANGRDRTTGANYALHPPSDSSAVNPAGEWNQTRIVVNNRNVEHWLNGVQVVAYELGSADWNERVQNSKFTEWPDYGLATEGHLALQDHGDPVWFRNIRVREL